MLHFRSPLYSTNLRHETYLKVKNNNDTRWSSCFEMIRRLCELRENFRIKIDEVNILLPNQSVEKRLTLCARNFQGWMGWLNPCKDMMELFLHHEFFLTQYWSNIPAYTVAWSETLVLPRAQFLKMRWSRCNKCRRKSSKLPRKNIWSFYFLLIFPIVIKRKGGFQFFKELRSDWNKHQNSIKWLYGYKVPVFNV